VVRITPGAVIDAVLFDWRGTTFTDQADADWIRDAAASIGRTLSAGEVESILDRGATVMRERPDIRDALDRSDISPEVHRAANMAWFDAIGLDEDLAVAIYERDGHPEASYPFADCADVMRTLKEHGKLIALVSNIHYDLRDHFRRHQLDRYVDAWVFSYEHSCQKPDAEMFTRALDALGVTADRALMVGDRPELDGGAVECGILTLLLPVTANGDPPSRGLDAVLRLVGVE
jgi:HAD superfamily hydrolase (TIGR01549 family)